jgi:hypothetical protein
LHIDPPTGRSAQALGVWDILDAAAKDWVIFDNQDLDHSLAIQQKLLCDHSTFVEPGISDFAPDFLECF